MCEPADGEDCSEMLSAEHDTAVTGMNSRWLWLPTSDLHTIETIQLLVQMEEMISRPYTLLEIVGS